MKPTYREMGTQQQHVYMARRKMSGWYGRRFGRNPKYKFFPHQKGLRANQEK